MTHDYSKNVVIRENVIARGGRYELHTILLDEALAQSGIGVKRDDMHAAWINVMLRLVQLGHRAGFVEGAAAADQHPTPINMILHCPNCGMQHIDAPEWNPKPDQPGVETLGWTNPPHRSHLCHGCGHIWRPADVPTNGVAEIKTKGKNDSAEPNYNTQNEAQGYALEAIHQFVPELRFRDDGQTLMTPAQVETVLRRMGWKPPGEQRAAPPAPTEPPPLSWDQESRGMFVARLEAMQEHGDRYLTIAAILALLNDCDMLASLSSPMPDAPTDSLAALRDMLRAEVDRVIAGSDVHAVYEKCANIAEAHDKAPASIIAACIREHARNHGR